jgi:lipopolysaccharide biosynthesis protein
MLTLAMFLPQFHECQQNNIWWGKGFTEWDNVKSAQPFFVNHRQPRIPLNGYYDLTSPGELEDQFAVARKYNIDGFNIYHYWSSGERLLNSIVDELLPKTSTVKYCLTWANHPWTRTWTNRNGASEILFDQSYESNIKDISRHAAYLADNFVRHNYIKINGRPLLFIYKCKDIVNQEWYLRSLREQIIKLCGMNIFIVGMFKSESEIDAIYKNVDSISPFNPSNSIFSESREHIVRSFYARLPSKVKAFTSWFYDKLKKENIRQMDYESAWNHLVENYIRLRANYGDHLIPMIFTDFDNTPRYKNRARVFKNANPEVFENRLNLLLNEFKHSNLPEILLINAWNEWGEGMYLQPDLHYGYMWLEITKKFIDKANAGVYISRHDSE